MAPNLTYSMDSFHSQDFYCDISLDAVKFPGISRFSTKVFTLFWFKQSTDHELCAYHAREAPLAPEPRGTAACLPGLAPSVAELDFHSATCHFREDHNLTASSPEEDH